ncbi:cation/H(+) antiporter 4-like [Vicia villosa]|uniref:cation/H(+) antiporter 4-like n=1 Tax=Vicia villosa TaxID=3911 RepID=UPI00273AA03D|nr:cation/H(+) antiporter 4-like [Vicia villosa]
MNSSASLFTSIVLLYEDNITGRHQVYNVCIEQPQMIIAEGIWASHTIVPPKSSFTMLEIQIIIIFFITQFFHFFLKRLGFSCFISQVMAGFLLGPSISLGPLDEYKKMLFPFGGPDILNTISSYGYAFFLFLNSVQMDFTLIRKTGKKSLVIALLSYYLPIMVGFLIIFLTRSVWINLVGEEQAYNLPIVVISHSGCSFAVIASLLRDIGILNSELGRLALSSAFLNDIAGNVFAGAGTAIVSTMERGMFLTVKNLLLFFVYLFGIPLIGRPIMMRMVKNTPEGKPINKIYINAIVLAFFLLGMLAGNFNQPFLAGAVILGLAVPEGPPLGSELVNQFELFSTWILTPLFVTCCVMKVDLTLCGPPILIIVVIGFILMVHTIKLLQCMIVCKYCNMPTTDGLCLALILSCKGVVDCCSFILVYDGTKKTPESIGIMVISTLVFATISKLGVKALYDPSRKYAGYQKRNIMNLKQNSELRLVAVVHRASHMVHVKNFLSLCSPAPDNVLIADVVHVMELIGRTTPIFISHRLQQKTGSTHNYSGELVVTFDLFERDHAGSATANTYTAISPQTFMQDDVCYLALDKNAAIIILPFHIRWTPQGLIESDDNMVRTLNSKVLERAPCSIGILVNRGNAATRNNNNSNNNNSTGYKVAMVFLGGPDDREALCLAKRFSKNLDNSLYVYRLLASDQDAMGWEKMIDDEELREVRGSYIKLENVKYEEKTIQDASETTTFIRDIANKFDFIIVGRRNGVKSPQTLGLENWTEYTELGVIGDLLASPDMETKASVLVVQQQQQTNYTSST